MNASTKRENLALNVGGFYPAMRLRPRRYLRTCSPAVKEWLQNMRRRQVRSRKKNDDASGWTAAKRRAAAFLAKGFTRGPPTMASWTPKGGGPAWMRDAVPKGSA